MEFHYVKLSGLEDFIQLAVLKRLRTVELLTCVNIKCENVQTLAAGLCTHITFQHVVDKLDETLYHLFPLISRVKVTDLSLQ